VRQGLLALTLAVLVLLALDLGLRAVGALPPDDPLLFFVKSRTPHVDPFVPAGPGRVQIRPDWVNDGLGLRGRRGLRAGRQFLLPGFRPAQLAVPKPPGTLRILALGGSTTYGLYVGGEEAFPAVLQRRLARRAGDRRVEVVNLGCPGFASDRVAALLGSVLYLDPDLVVVLAGHNEMLGGDVGPASGLSPALRLRAWLLEHSSLFAWWNHLLARTLRSARTEAVREEVAALEAGQIPTFVPEEVPATLREPPSAEFRARAARRYARNLDAMIDTARGAGVPLVFALPAANLRRPPGIPVHPPGFSAEADFDQELRAAHALLASGKARQALARADAALALDPEHAGALAARGDALLALGREDEARAAYRAAVDRDARTHRITTRLSEAAVAELGARDADWVDLRPVFQQELSDTGARALFVDHVHPTAEGHARIAEALLPDVAARLGL
jgi:lysophospholipase L1-like esterase